MIEKLAAWRGVFYEGDGTTPNSLTGTTLYNFPSVYAMGA